MSDSDFYLETLEGLLARDILRKDMTVLVICGGPYDKETLLTAGFKQVTISNINSQPDPKEYEPYEWSSQDCEDLPYQDATFDFGIVHSGLHHCTSPHRGLLELFRVCRQGVLVFEPKDNFLVRLGVKLNLGQEYETFDVEKTNYLGGGGVKNTPIPNYVYRWTERDVIQTINCYAPYGNHRYIFMHALRIPWWRWQKLSKMPLKSTIRIFEPVLKVLSKIFPVFNNNFAFAVVKARVPEDLHPWLKHSGDDITVKCEWFASNYKK